MLRTVLCLTLAGLATAAGAQISGEPAPQVSESIQVTATRVPEDVLDVPASVTIVTGAELEARGIHDLAGALSLAAGISIAPGGDGGPASSVPEIMGLREFDAFLLVVDSVPWGGAFNPALSTLDLTNVERIEVLRGAAPVLYGATSFVGVIHVIHRAPDDTPTEASGWVGNHDSFGAAVRSELPGTNRFRHSISSSIDRQDSSDRRDGFDRGHTLWNGILDTQNGGHLRLSFDFTALRQNPSSPHPRVGKVLSGLVPIDANHNPSDARIDENRGHFVVAYDHKVGMADWTTTAAFTHSRRTTVRGFLREEFDVPSPVSNADGYRQHFSGSDLYLDSHLAWNPDPALSLVAGVDLLAGKGTAESNNFEYHITPQGTGVPSSADLPIDERPSFEDRRRFAGAYVQALWKPSERWTIDTGLRLNQTYEEQEGEVRPGDGAALPADEAEGARDSRSETRLSGSFGASYRVWCDRSQAVWLYADYKDAFKPAAVDFGPEAEGEILDPETAQTVEAGVKGVHAGGRFSWQASVFRMDFDNLVVAATVNGLPTLENAGQQRFEGYEIEGRWQLAEDFSVTGSYASHSAKFRDYVREFDGVPTQLRGNRLEMSPDALAALGFTYAPERGWTAWASGNYVGARYLDKRNRALAGSYTTLAAGIGYRFERTQLRLDGDNLTDERPPVAESELGDAQYYLLPSRALRATLVWRF